jgi:hypothetical protein
MQDDDPALVTLKEDSAIAAALLKKAKQDGVKFQRSQLKRAKGLYTCKDPLITLDVKSGFDIAAHEAVHHHHRKSNKQKHQLFKDVILKRLLHEAEAYAIQALVVLEAYENGYSDPHKRKRIDKGIERICEIYPNFNEELDKHHDNDSKRKLALKIFQAYLLDDNKQFDNHLVYYAQSQIPASASIAMLSSIMGSTFYAGERIITGDWDIGPIAYLVSAAFVAMKHIQSLPDQYMQSDFKTIFDKTSIGDIPTIAGNYLDDIRSLDKDNPLFDRVLQRVSSHVNARMFNFEKGIALGLMAALPR